MKMYTRPEIEISVFATEDIITASGDPATITLTDAGTLGAAPATGAATPKDEFDYDTANWQ